MIIAIWGTGYAAKRIVSLLGSDYSISFFIDKDCKKQKGMFQGRKVISPDDISNNVKSIDGILVAVTNLSSQYEIASILMKYKGLKAGFFRNPPDTWNGDMSSIRWIEIGEKGILPYIECNLIDACNLNCKACSHFSNLFIDNREEYGEDSFENDMRILSEHIEPVTLRLLGGEPLLSKGLETYMNAARRFFPDAEIFVVTNGLLILKQDESFFQVLRDNEIRIFISTYHPTAKILELIKKKLEEENIQYDYNSEIQTFKKVLNPFGNSDKNKAHEMCDQRHCVLVRNGKIYNCPIDGLIYKYFDTYDQFEKPNYDCGRAIKDIDDWEKVYQGFCKPFDTCRFCDEGGGVDTEWKIAMHPEASDWISDKGKISVSKRLM